MSLLKTRPEAVWKGSYEGCHAELMQVLVVTLDLRAKVYSQLRPLCLEPVVLSLFERSPPHPPNEQATLTRRWCQWLCQKARNNGKVPLLLNLDETAVPLEFTHTKGNIITRLAGKKIKEMPKQLANRSAVRCFFTHVAIICDDPTVQPLLPQVMFFAGRHLSWKNWTELQEALPKNVFSSSAGLWVEQCRAT